MEFRKAQQADTIALQTMARNNIRMHYRHTMGDSGVADFLDSGAPDRYVASNLDNCTVMYNSHEILGFAVCKDDLITLLMVATNKQGSGIGTQLLRHCEDRLLARYDQIKLESFEGNSAANQFYEHCGWALSQRQAGPGNSVYKYIYIKRANPRNETDHSVTDGDSSCETEK